MRQKVTINEDTRPVTCSFCELSIGEVFIFQEDGECEVLIKIPTFTSNQMNKTINALPLGGCPNSLHYIEAGYSLRAEDKVYKIKDITVTRKYE